MWWNINNPSHGEEARHGPSRTTHGASFETGFALLRMTKVVE
jgi:hypothetical protein